MRMVISVGALCVGVAALVLVIAARSAPPSSAGDEVEKVAARIAALQQTAEQQTDALTARIDELEQTVTELKKSIAQLKRKRLTRAFQTPQNRGISPAAEKPQTQSAPAANILKNLDEKTKKQLLEELTRLQAEQRLQRTEQFVKQLHKEVLNDVSRYGQDNGWDVTKEEQVKRILDEAFDKMRKLFREMAAGRRPRRGFFMTMRQIGEETRKRLLEFMTEEELQNLARRIRGPLGRAIGGGFPPPARRAPQKPPAPPNR